jgi:hypothetical protein
VANHFSLRREPRGTRFLINPERAAFRPDHRLQPGGDRRDGPGHDGPARCAGPHGLGAAWQHPPRLPACPLLMHVHSAHCHGAGQPCRQPPCRRSTRTRRCSSAVMWSTTTTAAWPSRRRRPLCRRCWPIPRFHDDHGQPWRAGDRARRGRGIQPPVLFRARRRHLYPRPADRPPAAGAARCVAEKTAREWEDYPGFAEISCAKSRRCWTPRAGLRQASSMTSSLLATRRRSRTRRPGGQEGRAFIVAGTGTPIRVRMDGASASWSSTTSGPASRRCRNSRGRNPLLFAGAAMVAAGVLAVVGGHDHLVARLAANGR